MPYKAIDNLVDALSVYLKSLSDSELDDLAPDGIVNLGNFLAVSPPRTTANLLICRLGVGRARLKIVEICLNLTMPLAVVNSPIDVTVNGKSAEVLAAVGYPGAVDGYQVNFRVPPDTGAGTATLQISSAWIPGAPVTIAVQ